MIVVFGVIGLPKSLFIFGIHNRRIILAVAVFATACSCDSNIQTLDPQKSVLIGSRRTSGPDAALIAKFNESLISKFEEVSAWNVVLVSEFDYELVGDPREREMHRLGLRFFLSTRVSADSYNDIYVRAVLTDAWTEKNIWTQNISGSKASINSLASEIAHLTHNTLGDP